MCPRRYARRVPRPDEPRDPSARPRRRAPGPAGGNPSTLPLRHAHEPARRDALVAELGGSISAEHGVGIAKRRWLGLTRGAVDMAAMRAIKRALDPAGLLNPGVLFEGSDR